MKRKLIYSLILTLLMAVAIPGLAWAAPKELVSDRFGVLTESELEKLNNYAAGISQEAGMDVAFVLVEDTYMDDQSLAEYGQEIYYTQLDLASDGFMLIIDVDSGLWDILVYGSARGLITEDIKLRLLDNYNDSDTYYGGIYAYLEAAKMALHTQHEPNQGGLTYVVDMVGLLSQSELDSLEKRLAQVSAKHNFDTVVAITPELKIEPAELFAADFYEQNGFGQGEELDGAILLLATEDRDYGFATTGFGLYAFTSAGQEYLDKHYLPFLKNDEYFKAFMAYADAVDDFLNMAEAGTPYDKGNIKRTEEEIKKIRNYGIAGSFILPFITSFFFTRRWRGELTSVRGTNLASSYIHSGSMNIVKANEAFLYQNVHRSVRVVKDKDDNVFTSSSGRTFTGRSGKY